MITMRNTIAYLLMIFLLTLVSCNEYLEYNQEDFYSENLVFEEYGYTSDVLNNIYSHLPGGLNEIGPSMRASASDDALEAKPTSSIHVMNDGRWQAANPIDSKWGSMYKGIRAANKLIKNHDASNLDDRRYNDNYEQQLREYRLFDDQARFLRAYFYFELMRRYGGVPLLNGEILSLEEVNNQQRNSFEEIKNFIVDECDAVIDSLPLNYEELFSGQHKGRATRGTAMALKARTLLYAASPLHGSSQEEWAAAAEAAHAIIDSGWYNLEGNYEDVVNNSGSNELIMGRRLSRSNDFERNNFPAGFEQARPGTCPTQNLVNTYEMANGGDIDEAGSGYDPDHPYENRDPRLKQTILVNNSNWKGRNVEIWKGGLDGPPQRLATETGYYLKKYVQDNVSLDPYNPSTAFHLWVLFRYGEVLLNYAEAMNEAYGPTADPQGYGMNAIEAMNMIRNRAGLPDYAGDMNKEAVREEIREERRVELAFEDHRFWDLRRWEILEENSEIWGMKITQNDDGTLDYNKEVVEERQWESWMSLYPIPQNEVDLTNMSQNTGW